MAIFRIDLMYSTCLHSRYRLHDPKSRLRAVVVGVVVVRIRYWSTSPFTTKQTFHAIEWSFAASTRRGISRHHSAISAQHPTTPIRFALLSALITKTFHTRPSARRRTGIPARRKIAILKSHEVRPLIHANVRNGMLASAQPTVRGEKPDPGGYYNRFYLRS